MPQAIVPFQLVIALDALGQLENATATWRTVYFRDDGTPLPHFEVAETKSIDVVGAEEFPLARWLSEAQLAALATVETQNAALIATRAEVDRLQQALDDARDRVAELQDKLAAAQASAAAAE